MQESLLTCVNNEEVGDLKERIFEESSKIWKVALPGILSRVASFGSVVVTQSFIGHVGELELAGYALVQTLSVRFINGILVYNLVKLINYSQILDLLMLLLIP